MITFGVSIIESFLDRHSLTKRFPNCCLPNSVDVFSVFAQTLVFVITKSGLLTHFFLFAFCKNIIDLPTGQINDPASEMVLDSFDPPSNSGQTVLSRTIEWLFELGLGDLHDPTLPRVLPP